MDYGALKNGTPGEIFPFLFFWAACLIGYQNGNPFNALWPSILFKDQKMLNAHELAIFHQMKSVCGKFFIDLIHRHLV